MATSPGTKVVGLALIFGLAEVAPAAGAPDAYLVKDINPSAASDPVQLRHIGGALFFTANDGSSGQELWTSNGTEAGTWLIKDIRAGADGSFPRPVTNLQGALLFSAADGARGFELWTSDGTTAGTGLLKDLNPGEAGSDPAEITRANDVAFFTAYVNGLGRELWKSDGTAAGTVLVSDINPGPADSSPAEMVLANRTLFFRADDGLPSRNHRELWKSDGTAAGTMMVKDIQPGPGESNPSSLAVLNGQLYFAADDGTHGVEAWTSDGTEAGTFLLKDIRPGPGSGGFGGPTIVNDVLFFLADDGIHGRELWKTVGTEAGTEMIKDITPSGSSSIIEMTAAGGRLYFAIFDDLWTSDGTEGGTVRIKDFDSRTTYPLALRDLTDVSGTLFFVANDGVHGAEVWMSDGTAARTVLAADVQPGDRFSFSWPAQLTGVGGTLFFQADDGIHGAELWAIGPSAPGVVPDGGAVEGGPLRVGRGAGADITLTWDRSSCATGATDYVIYEGSLGSFPSHDPVVCSTGGATTWTLTPRTDNSYYLVVPVLRGMEGSYDIGSDGVERPQGAHSCGPQLLGPTCF